MKKIRDQVPYCAGRNFPKYHIPKGACDCHHHIYDPVRYAYQPSDTRNQPPSTVDVYRMLQKKLGLSRNVIVQPSAYGTDNRCTLDALRAMGKEQTRAIVVVDESVTDADLTAYHDQGVRGIRFNINCGYSGDWTKIERLAERIAPMGWSAFFASFPASCFLHCCHSSQKTRRGKRPFWQLRLFCAGNAHDPADPAPLQPAAELSERNCEVPGSFL